jgi:hypothetical protein
MRRRAGSNTSHSRQRCGPVPSGLGGNFRRDRRLIACPTLRGLVGAPPSELPGTAPVAAPQGSPPDGPQGSAIRTAQRIIPNPFPPDLPEPRSADHDGRGWELHPGRLRPEPPCGGVAVLTTRPPEAVHGLLGPEDRCPLGEGATPAAPPRLSAASGSAPDLVGRRSTQRSMS